MPKLATSFAERCAQMHDAAEQLKAITEKDRNVHIGAFKKVSDWLADNRKRYFADE